MAVDLAEIFDVGYYARANPDLGTVGLTTFDQLFNHFQDYGLQEGRDFSAVIDLEYYAEQNPDLASVGLRTNEQLAWHLCNYGINEKRDFSPFIDLDYYSQQNPDLAAAGLINGEQLFWHLTNYGVNEKREFSSNVDLDFYFNKYPDLFAAGLTTGEELLEHIVRYGDREGRQLTDIPERQLTDIPEPEQSERTITFPLNPHPPSLTSFSSQSLNFSNQETILEKGLNQAIDHLQKFASNSNVYDNIQLAFGDRLDLDKAKALISKLWDKQQLPNIEVLSGEELQGELGAFDSLTNTAYISQDFLAQNAENLETVSRVILEKVGHAIDDQLNSSDAPGDEGEIFAMLAVNDDLSPSQLVSLKYENDFENLSINELTSWVKISQISFLD